MGNLVGGPKQYWLLEYQYLLSSVNQELEPIGNEVWGSRTHYSGSLMEMDLWVYQLLCNQWHRLKNLRLYFVESGQKKELLKSTCPPIERWELILTNCQRQVVNPQSVMQPSWVANKLSLGE